MVFSQQSTGSTSKGAVRRVARAGVALLAGASLLAGAACASGGAGGASSALPPGVTTAMVEEGRVLYMGDGLCASCHGDMAEGSSMGPDLRGASWIHIDGSFDSLVQVITDGVMQPRNSAIPMLPMGGGDITTAAQVRAVAAYIWTLSRGGV